MFSDVARFTTKTGQGETIAFHEDMEWKGRWQVRREPWDDATQCFSTRSTYTDATFTARKTRGVTLNDLLEHYYDILNERMERDI